MGTVLTIFGYNLTYLELIGSIFNFISVILATKANLWNWVTSIVAQICFFFLFWYTGLYANMLLQIYFTYICLISIFIWKKTDKDEDKGLIFMTNKQRIITFISIIISIILGWLLLDNIDKIFPVKSENPFLDVTVLIMSVVGINLLSKKYIESWYVWIVTDIFCVGLFFYSGIFVVGIEYIIFTGMAIYGLFNWLKIKYLNNIVR